MQTLSEMLSCGAVEILVAISDRLYPESGNANDLIVVQDWSIDDLVPAIMDQRKQHFQYLDG
jgi:hypothetical protein